MKYTVIRFDTERELVVLGKTNSFEEAKSMMQKDFRSVFFQQYGDVDFADCYKRAHEDSECELGVAYAWLNDYCQVGLQWYIIDNSVDVMEKPYSKDQLQEKVTGDNPYVEGFVMVDMNELIQNDLENILDILSIRLTGSELLMDISYSAVEVTEDGQIVVWVRGDASDCLD